jgi:hypothetical protein
MALSILDGNQTAVTLATTVSGGAHFPNHIIASGTVTANGGDFASPPAWAYPAKALRIGYADDENYNAVGLAGGGNPLPVVLYNTAQDPIGSSVSGSIPLVISGTVTANSSNGELTTRFGSVTTANTAFSTTAVTNTSRKYLIIQNIASTVITVGIGFTPTTTQGIQLVAGATITFDGNYIPTGAVRILSSVTASNFTVLEA